MRAMLPYVEKMMTTRYIGADPGARGAVAVLYDDGNIELIDLTNELEQYIQLTTLLNHDIETYVMVEDVCGRPGQSCQANTTFMKLAGYAEFLGMYVSYPNGAFGKVKPQVWKKYFGLITRGLTKTEKKHLSIDLAKRLFPSVADQLTLSKDGRAEALLLARYCYDEVKRINEEAAKKTD